jgi:hypothetical protein
MDAINNMWVYIIKWQNQEKIVKEEPNEEEPDRKEGGFGGIQELGVLPRNLWLLLQQDNLPELL